MSPCSTPSPKKRQLPQIPIQAQHTNRDRGKLASFVVYLDSASSYEELLQVKLSTLHLGVLRILAIKLNKSVKIVFLTRFNKIAIQGTPQMAVDKEAICLSRVYSYYPKCNFPLFYV